jgi:chromate transport protein ChrA
MGVGDVWTRGAGAVAVFAAIVLSPLILLALLAWIALRARNRRIEARLLEEPQPGASTHSS